MSEQLTTKPKPFCFVIMPFDQSFDDLYKLGIKEGCNRAGAYCERVDEQHYNELIINRVYNQIAKSDFVIAIVTDKNPNVFYELGYAHALGKPTILLTDKKADIPFNISGFPHIIYDNISILIEELAKRLKHYISEMESKSDYKIDLEMFYNFQSLTNEKVEIEIPHNVNLLKFEFLIFNGSMKTYKENQASLTIILSDPSISIATNLSLMRDLSSEILPDGRYLFNLGYLRFHLFPEAYYPIQLNFSFNNSMISHYDSYHIVKAIFRIHTTEGFRDFPFKIRVNLI